MKGSFVCERIVRLTKWKNSQINKMKEWINEQNKRINSLLEWRKKMCELTQYKNTWFDRIKNEQLNRIWEWTIYTI